MSALDALRAATPVRKTVWLCMDAGLQADWDAILAEYEDSDDQGSLAKPSALEMAERLDAIRDQFRASEVGFTFERLGPWEDVALKSAHPPRDGEAIDRIRGYNIQTYFPALIRASCVAVHKRGEEPEPVPEDVWASLLGTPAEDDKPAVRGTLNTKQTNDLIAAAQYVNDAGASVPPSARSLLESQDSGASLALPDPGTSPRDGSEVGNRPGSPSTSTKKKARKQAGSSAP